MPWKQLKKVFFGPVKKKNKLINLFNMDGKNKNLNDFNIPLILTEEINKQSNINIEILKIKDLIKLKYLNNIKHFPLNNNIYSNQDFDSIKNAAKKIEYDIREKKTSINESIKIQEIELKKLYNEKELLNQNKIQSDIINNQQKLIDNYKKNNIELKLNLNVEKKTLEKEVLTNKTFLINNGELKTTINRYIVHNKKLQDNINLLKKDYLETSFSKSQINEMLVKIKFYQEENIRLSSELNFTKDKYETIKNNFNKVELEKNNIFKQIKELNNSLIKTNVIGTPFVKDLLEEDSINSNVLNEISNTNLEDKNKKKEKIKNFDDKKISDIFE